MYKKNYRLREKEKPKKKYRGIFENVIPMYPLGGGRIIKIKKEDGKNLFLNAHFRPLLREEKKVKLGDRVEIDYKNYRDFTMRKLTGDE